MKNKTIFGLALLALVFLSGCIVSPNDLENAICTHPPNPNAKPPDAGGIREQYGRDTVVFCQKQLARAKQGIDDFCNSPEGKKWPNNVNCENMQTTLEQTGWNEQALPPEQRTVLYNCKCTKKGLFGNCIDYEVRFSSNQSCGNFETCEESIAGNPSTDAYCRQLDCRKDELFCGGDFSCDKKTGLCRPFDCREPYNDACPQHCDQETGKCKEQGPPPACTTGNSRILEPPSEPTPVHGLVYTKIGVDSTACPNPDRVEIRVDNSQKCNITVRRTESGLEVFDCVFDSTGLLDGSHDFLARTFKGLDTFNLTQTIKVCNDNDSVPFNCIADSPVCPAECETDLGLACGTYKPECCSDPQTGCKTLKPECEGKAGLDFGTKCSAGICNPDGSCGCPMECTNRANERANQRCGTDWPVTPDCAAINCGYAPQVGFNCDATPETRCVNYNGTTDCRSGNDIACGTVVNPVDSSLGEPIVGLYCDAQNNSSHKLCDSTISTCVPIPANNLANSAKYLMDISTDNQAGMAYNAWFRYLLPEHRDYGLPTFGFDKWFGFGYSEIPVGIPLNFFKKNEQQPSFEEGLARFEIENTQLSGPQNYALFNFTDLTRPSGQKTEKIIFKLDAGYSGKCVPEDRKFRGQSGATAKPKVSYNWGWGFHSTKMKQCDYNNNSGVYCDATQFTIALFDRLQLMREKAEDGNRAFAASLKEWDANLMKDGFTNDFLLDFNYFENNNEFASPPSWFKTTWANYFGQPLRISFSPNAIDAPGRYHAKLNITWHAEDWVFFDSSDLPKADIEVQFTKIADAEPMHPFYLLPFDFEVGKSTRSGEAAPDRNGYGTNFQGDPLPLSDSYSASPTGTEITVEKYDSFAKTNPIGQRGKLLTIDLQNDSIVFSPVIATPIAMKLENSNGYAQGFYSLKSGGQEVPLDSVLSLGSWTGIGSKNLGDPCNGFHPPNPLFFRRSDKAPGTGSAYCTQGTTSPNMRGFWWDGLTGNQTIFAQTVFYAPSESFLANNYCPQGNMDWVSPIEHLSGALNLNYTADQDLDVETVSDILDRVADGSVCQYITPDKQSVTFYWDRNQLESAIDESDLALIGMEPSNHCNR